MFGGPEWGIFDQNGNAIIEADSVFGVEYARDFHISDYPQEQGAFESYNKVKVPYQAKVTFLISSSVDDRSTFLTALEQAVASLDLVTVVTPEITYPSANLTHMGYRREARQGATLLRVEVWCEEVRIVQTGGLSNTSSTTSSQINEPQSTNAVPQQDNGSVQAEPTTAVPTTTGATTASANLVTGLGTPSGASGSSSLASPNIGPAFYDGTNLPKVPSAFGQATPEQQQTAIDYGTQTGATAVAAIPPAQSPQPNGATDPSAKPDMEFRFSDKPLSIFKD